MSQPRLIQLDLLRACCVFLVLGRHLTPTPQETSLIANKITQFWNFGGWVGVDIFFVLSGFLISGLLFREYQKNENLRIKRFLIRRGLKIYPSFYILIGATVLINPLFGKTVPTIPLIAEILFLQNLIFGRLWIHTWTLAVEEHFYIGLAILAYFLIRYKKTDENPFSHIPNIFLFLVIICFVLRLLMATFKGTNIAPTPFRIDALFFGVMLSYLWHFCGFAEKTFINRYKNWFIFGGVVMLLPMFFFMSVINPWVFVLGLTTNYIAGGLLLVGFLKTEFKVSLFLRTISSIGTYSYSIYLWHLPVQEWLAIPLNSLTGINNWFFYAGVYLIGSILIGIFLSKIIEYPILRIRDRYFPSPHTAVVNNK
jgi:peptidoglycan/LPS O-acetylase OafA/YrhL